MAPETKSLGEATCPVRRCSDDAYYRTTKNPRVFNYRCSTGEHWGNLRIDALGAIGAHMEPKSEPMPFSSGWCNPP